MANAAMFCPHKHQILNSVLLSVSSRLADYLHRYGSACPLDYLRSCCRALGLPTPDNVSALIYANIGVQAFNVPVYLPSPFRVGRLLRYWVFKVHRTKTNPVFVCFVS